MNSSWLLLIIFTCILAIFTGIPVIYRIMFLMGGLYILTLLILQGNLKKLSIKYDLLNSTGFAGTEHSVIINLTNTSRFPIFWCTLLQVFPETLGSKVTQFLTTLSPGASTKLKISFWSIRRGIYQLPVTRINAGDPFGLSEKERTYECAEKIIIYPQLVTVVGLETIRHLPLGKYNILFGLYEDSSRLRGCREYSAGDDTRKIHWPNLARTGNLQVKDWETTLNTEIAVFLDLEEASFPVQEWFTLSEIGIELAASIIHLLVKQGERVGFYCNGKAAEETPNIFKLPPKNGSEQEKRILTYLAGVNTGERDGFATFFEEAKRLAAGSCLIFITPRITPECARKSGYLIKMGYHPVFLWLSSRTIIPPAGELKQAKTPWFTIERKQEGNVLQAINQG